MDEEYKNMICRKCGAPIIDETNYEGDPQEQIFLCANGHWEIGCAFKNDV